MRSLPCQGPTIPAVRVRRIVNGWGNEFKGSRSGVRGFGGIIEVKGSVRIGKMCASADLFYADQLPFMLAVSVATEHSEIILIAHADAQRFARRDSPARTHVLSRLRSM